MIVNYSLRQVLESCHHAKSIGLESILLWRTFDDYKITVLLVIPFSSKLHYGIFDTTHIRKIDL